MKIEQRNVESLIPYVNNSRKHSDEQVAQIAASIKEFGWTNPILVDGENGIIAGHGRLMAARKLAMDKVPVIELAHLSDGQRKALIIADNKLALNADWDYDLLKIELNNLIENNFDIKVTGFTKEEINDIIFEQEDVIDHEEESKYTKKIEPPIYEPTGAKPLPSNLYDRKKTKQLIDEIESATISQEVKDFLLYAAERHTVFDFRNIAEFYANATAEEQLLMEKSALVIIDFNKAIEYGFVKLSEAVAKQYARDYKHEK